MQLEVDRNMKKIYTLVEDILVTSVVFSNVTLNNLKFLVDLILIGKYLTIIYDKKLQVIFHYGDDLIQKAVFRKYLILY